jgi:hypothetical protein
MHAHVGSAKRGLDGVFSAALARPAGQAARGFVVELLAWHLGWRSDVWQQSSGQCLHDATWHEEEMRRLQGVGAQVVAL